MKRQILKLMYLVPAVLVTVAMAETAVYGALWDKHLRFVTTCADREEA